MYIYECIYIMYIYIIYHLYMYNEKLQKILKSLVIPIALFTPVKNVATITTMVPMYNAVTPQLA